MRAVSLLLPSLLLLAALAAGCGHRGPLVPPEEAAGPEPARTGGA